jgi:predicted NodU family carbamoyl transferase
MTTYLGFEALPGEGKVMGPGSCGEFMVCGLEDAINCFKKSQMDCLVLGGYVTERKLI